MDFEEARSALASARLAAKESTMIENPEPPPAWVVEAASVTVAETCETQPVADLWNRLRLFSAALGRSVSVLGCTGTSASISVQDLPSRASAEVAARLGYFNGVGYHELPAGNMVVVDIEEKAADGSGRRLFVDEDGLQRGWFDANNVRPPANLATAFS